jgi:hypothetical protein
MAESGPGERTMLDVAGPVWRQMLQPCSPIRMEAKRDALEAVWIKGRDDQPIRGSTEALLTYRTAYDCARVRGAAKRRPDSRRIWTWGSYRGEASVVDGIWLRGARALQTPVN